jgi:hypothetical protein
MNALGKQLEDKLIFIERLCLVPSAQPEMQDQDEQPVPSMTLRYGINKEVKTFFKSVVVPKESRSQGT